MKRKIADRIQEGQPGVHKESHVIPCKESIRPQLLTEKMAAAYTGISLASLRRGRAGEQKIKNRTPMPRFVNVWARVYYPITELDRWLSELQLKEVIS
jgi:hypothetical protein